MHIFLNVSPVTESTYKVTYLLDYLVSDALENTVIMVDESHSVLK